MILHLQVKGRQQLPAMLDIQNIDPKLDRQYQTPNWSKLWSLRKFYGFSYLGDDLSLNWFGVGAVWVVFFWRLGDDWLKIRFKLMKRFHFRWLKRKRYTWADFREISKLSFLTLNFHFWGKITKMIFTGFLGFLQIDPIYDFSRK